MRNQKSKIKHQRSPRGFTVVECLIGLAISAILLTALATAFHASVMNYGENEQMYETINNARQALTRMTSKLRTGHTIDPSAAANRCNFYTAADEISATCSRHRREALPDYQQRRRQYAWRQRHRHVHRPYDTG
jgi:prepilin-type N-terminal cleavage/methylation domain-containing protein